MAVSMQFTENGSELWNMQLAFQFTQCFNQKGFIFNAPFPCD